MLEWIGSHQLMSGIIIGIFLGWILRGIRNRIWFYFAAFMSSLGKDDKKEK